MSGNETSDSYSEEETVRRREAILRRIVNTPPKPLKPKAPSGKPRGRPKKDKPKEAK